MESTDNRTMQDLCRAAVAVQNACNLSGVVHSFSRDISRLRELLNEEPNFSTTKLNQHPVSVLYASKIASLTESESCEAFSKAWSWCSEAMT